jgi:hypothetical protein
LFEYEQKYICHILYNPMYYTEIALIALIVVIAYMRPRVARGGLARLVLVLAVLAVARYTNRNSGILAAIAAIALIHVSNPAIEGMEQQVPPPLTDDDKLDDQAPAPAVDKCNEKLSKMDLECISRALRSCSSNEMPVNRDAVGATTQAPEGTIVTAGKTTEAFYA